MTETSAAPTHAPTPAPIHVRFFAAAAEAAGAQELRLPVPAAGIAVAELLADLPRMVREQSSSAASGADAPSLEKVCARSSFLINGVRARTETSRVRPGDQLDVLPPFAGG